MILKKIFKTIIYTIITALVLVGVYFLVNGGANAFALSIQSGGFFQFIADFFKGIWNGIITF